MVQLTRQPGVARVSPEIFIFTSFLNLKWINKKMVQTLTHWNSAPLGASNKAAKTALRNLIIMDKFHSNAPSVIFHSYGCSLNSKNTQGTLSSKCFAKQSKR